VSAVKNHFATSRPNLTGSTGLSGCKGLRPEKKRKGFKPDHVLFGRKAKKIQQTVDIALDAQLALIPGFEGYPGFEVFHLKPVFDVDF
jgi:hypothetical protein